MANELNASDLPASAGFYCIVRNSSGLFFAGGTTFEAYNSAHWGSYAVASASSNSAGFLTTSFPATIVAAGVYKVSLRQQAGGSPAITDPVWGRETPFDWNGSAEIPQTVSGLLDTPAGVESGLTVRQWFRLAGAPLMNITGDNFARIRDFNNGKNRLVTTFDGTGDRVAVTRDAT